MNENVDAQRDMEQRALRNVRGLVDKMEATDQLEGRKQKRVLLGLLLAAIVLAVIGAVALNSRKPPEVPVDVSKLPPLQGGPQKK